MLDGADGITWSDANLTEVGQGQARDVHGLWKKLLPKGLPPPDTFYVSPLTRTIETADLSFEGLELPDNKPYKPLIKEVREYASFSSGSLIMYLAMQRGSGRPHVRPTRPRLPPPHHLPAHNPRTQLL
jgi:broad specificity phosphatase PhoE